MKVQKATILWSFVLIILTCYVDVEAAKASRRGGSAKKPPNYDHVALSYGGSHRNHQPVQHHQQQAHQVHQTHSQPPHSPSAPPLPSNTHNNNAAKPAGWNVPHTETVNQPKTAQNTHSAPPYPQNPPPYQQNAGFNNHPAGPPPPYSANPNPAFNSHPPVGQPPAYQPSASYPVQHPPNAGYPQNTGFNSHPPAYQPAAYPGGSAGFAPSGQQAPVINNYYGHQGQPQSGGSSGPSLLGTALAAGGGAIAGNAIFSALKPDSEQKTIVIHENAPAPVVPPTSAVSPSVPAAPAAVPADSTPVAPMMPASPSVPLAPQDTGVRSDVTSDMMPTVPLAPIPDPSMQPSNASMASMAPMPDSSSTMQAASAAQPETSAVPTTTTTTTTTTLAPATGQSSVPLAPFPSDSAQAQKGSATSFVIFNVSVYTAISILIASIF